MNSAFFVYQGIEENTFDQSYFSLVERAISTLHQTEVIMKDSEKCNYQMVAHKATQNPIEIGLRFPTLCRKLYVRGGEIPPSVIETPQNLNESYSHHLFTWVRKYFQE